MTAKKEAFGGKQAKPFGKGKEEQEKAKPAGKTRERSQTKEKK
jgi:hypothetical protein